MTFEIESAPPSAFHASSFAGKHQAAFVLVDSEGDWPHNQSLYMHVNGKHHHLESASPHDLEQAGLDWLPKVLLHKCTHCRIQASASVLHMVVLRLPSIGSKVHTTHSCLPCLVGSNMSPSATHDRF